MKLSHNNRQNSIVMNMTPMIDVVFLLLIFFMMVSQVSEIKKERLELTKVKESGTDEQKPSTITVNVNEDGEIIVLGKTFSVAELVIEVGEELVALDNRLELLTIVVRVDRRASCQTVNEMVKQFEGLGVSRVRFAVEKEG